MTHSRRTRRSDVDSITRSVGRVEVSLGTPSFASLWSTRSPHPDHSRTRRDRGDISGWTRSGSSTLDRVRIRTPGPPPGTSQRVDVGTPSTYPEVVGPRVLLRELGSCSVYGGRRRTTPECGGLLLKDPRPRLRRGPPEREDTGGHTRHGRPASGDEVAESPEVGQERETEESVLSLWSSIQDPVWVVYERLIRKPSGEGPELHSPFDGGGWVERWRRKDYSRRWWSRGHVVGVSYCSGVRDSNGEGRVETRDLYDKGNGPFSKGEEFRTT